MKSIKSILCFCLILSLNSVYSQEDQKMNNFINDLMGKMTIEEKIGQLNLVTAGEATTGSVVSTDVESKIKDGNIGGIFSMTSRQESEKLRN